MGVGHSEPSRRREHYFGQAALLREDYVQVILVYLVVYFKLRGTVNGPFFFVDPFDTALFPEICQANPYLLFR
jgi:hypothetical protein